MSDWQTMFPSTTAPVFDEIGAFIASPLWGEINTQLQQRYGVKPALTYSGCSMQQGWNIKYKKSGKSLCTLYPMRGYFIALVVVGKKEMDRAQSIIGTCSDYVQDVFQQAKEGMGQKWLMIEVTQEEILDDAMKLIALRVTPPTERN